MWPYWKLKIDSNGGKVDARMELAVADR
jgi:hypothetical protein